MKRKFNFLSETLKGGPLKFDPASPTPIPNPALTPTVPGALPETKGTIAMPPPLPPSLGTPPPLPTPPSGPPMTNVNAVPNENHIPGNLSRITKVGKIDRFPRLYKVIKS